MAQLPGGTVTFLFTDIEGSTRLLKQLGARYDRLLAEHQRILRAAFAAHDGREVDTQGDSFFVAFSRAKDAVAAAVDSQRSLAANEWPDGVAVKVRMGLHTGEPRVDGERYVGIGVHKASRIGAAGHGGQVLLSRTTEELVEDDLPAGVRIKELGERRLRDLDRPERLAQLVIAGLPAEFAPLKTLDVEQRRRRRWLYVGAAAILAAGAVVAAALVSFGGGSGSANVEPNSVAVVDAAANRVVATTAVGIHPASIAADGGAIWVANVEDRSVSRIDPGTQKVVSNISLQSTPTGIAVGAGAVWIANGLLGSVTRVDTDVNVATKTIPVSFRSTMGGVAFADGILWAAFGSGEVAKLDPIENRVLQTGIVGVDPAGVATGEGAVWVANSGDNTVSRVNPRTTRAVRTFTVGRRPRSLDVGDGAVWVANEADGSVTRIDVASGSSVTIQVGRRPLGIAFGAGAVWVANSGDGTVSRIDPATNEVVKTIGIGQRPSGVVVMNGSVWVTVQASA